MSSPPTSHAPEIAPDDVPLQPLDWLALALPGLIWGSSFFLIAEGLDAFSPFLVTWLRLVFGFVVIAAVPLTRGPVPRSTWPRTRMKSARPSGRPAPRRWLRR